MDQNCKNLIVDYPRASVQFFPADEAAEGDQDHCRKVKPWERLPAALFVARAESRLEAAPTKPSHRSLT